ncbi:MAG: YfiT family bacillithiol transferase [Dyadobacter sp.]|uniref:YfiT family bacillithiol transferase n=1 Tax=Dyadobacter sp. TaxID=1914288 RepID=UPI0032659F99
MIDPKYPIGLFVLQEDYTKQEIEELIHVIATIPAEYKARVENLSEEDLLKTYREGSWNIRQLIHHVADLQFVHYLRLKKAVTEPDYNESTLIDMNAWAGTTDSLNAPISDSLMILEGVHHRYAFFAKSLTEEQLDVSYYHAVRKMRLTQKQALAMSVWHVKHHLAHIDIALGNAS